MQNRVEAQFKILFKPSLQFRQIDGVSPRGHPLRYASIVQVGHESFPTGILFPGIVWFKGRQQDSQFGSLILMVCCETDNSRTIYTSFVVKKLGCTSLRLPTSLELRSSLR